MTKKQALAEFKTLHPKELFMRFFRTGPSLDKLNVSEGIDIPKRDQAWNDFTDGLCKEGRITSKQYSTWTHPWN